MATGINGVNGGEVLDDQQSSDRRTEASRYLPHRLITFKSWIIDLKSLNIRSMSNKQAMKDFITPVANVSPHNSKIAIKVRIIHFWRHNEYASTNQSLEMILMDKEGDKIQATIRSKFVDKHVHNVRDGAIVVITQFSVAENRSIYSVMSHKYKINFYFVTSMQVVDEFDGPLNKFNFKPFDDILKKKDAKTDDVVDIIGCLTYVDEIIPYERPERSGKRLTFKLMDISGNELNGIFWDAYAEDLDSHTLTAVEDDSRIILLIQFAKLSEFKNEYSVSNAFAGTRLFFNADLPEVHQFKEEMLSIIESLPVVLKKVPTLSLTELSGPGDFIGQLTRITLDEISDHTRVSWYVCYATVNSIVEEDSWFHKACTTCHKKVIDMLKTHPEYGKNTTNVICPVCGPNPKSYYFRYMLHIRVVDDTGSVSFTLMDHDIKKFTKKSCGSIRKLMNEDDKSFPPEINNLVGKKLLFKVNVAQFNIDNNYFNYTVQGMTEDDEVIQAFNERFAIEQDEIGNPAIGVPDNHVEHNLASKDAISATGSNVEGVLSTAESPPPKRHCGDHGIDPNSVNKSTSAVKKKLGEGSLSKLDME